MSVRSTGDSYLHGYDAAEQARLVAQAEHWRIDLIRDGSRIPPGTRLLEVGCGVGAVLSVLGREFPRIELLGVDIAPEQLRFARAHLVATGVNATLIEGDAYALPLPDACVDHVWMMWLLEHLVDPVQALREARRVLTAGGRLTAIEVDYSTCRADPSSPAIEALFAAMVKGMEATGHSDAGTRLPGWLRQAGFSEIDPGERSFWWTGDDLERQANYAAAVVEGVVPSLAGLAGTASEARLRQGIADLRRLPARCDAGLGWTVHKSMAAR